MTSSTLHSLNLAPTQPSSVGEALHGLAIAGHRLALALWAAAGSRFSASQSRPAMTAFEEAEQLRAFAVEQIQCDPRFADDLFAAADRHEEAARA
ncbi:hypothetical protein [Rhodoferax ferrireducens]|uniref:hypothetical protein n=1 Tax=Rhodoferax ferrireducens TaxID=192843 RepID=UPI000E0D6DB2|nr:hypothetical protein [Rhodoferax ferrireducens]